MDREDLEAHVMASRSSRGELFDPGYLCRASDARPVRQEDLDFQARTDLRLLIGVDAHAAEARIDAAAAAEKAQNGAGEIHGCRTRGYEGRPFCSVPVFVIPMLAAPHRQTVHAPDAPSTGRRSPPG